MTESISDAGIADVTQLDLQRAIAGIARVMGSDATTHADLAEGFLLLSESLIALESSDEELYAEIGRKAFERLKEHNRRKRAEGEALRAEILLVCQELNGDITAKQVLEGISLDRIGRAALPSVRTVQWHLQHLESQLQFQPPECSNGNSS